LPIAGVALLPLALLIRMTPAALGGELRIVTHVLPPFTFEGRSAPVGLAVDIVEAVIQRTGDIGTIEVEPFPRLLRDVISGPNTLAFIIARTPERERLVQWVGPIIVNRVCLYTRAGSHRRINSLEEARSLAAIAVTRGDADHVFLAGKHFTNLDLGESQSLDLRKVALGRVDATSVSELVFASMATAARLQPTDFERTPVMLYNSVVYMAFSPDVAAWGGGANLFDGCDATGGGRNLRHHDRPRRRRPLLRQETRPQPGQNCLSSRSI
jgi:polar amino acid transport system substrate-binding protein